MPRIMIVCPMTERPVPTEVVTEGVPRTRSPAGGRVTCEACRRVHVWSRAETFVEGARRRRSPRRSRKVSRTRAVPVSDPATLLGT